MSLCMDHPLATGKSPEPADRNLRATHGGSWSQCMRESERRLPMNRECGVRSAECGMEWLRRERPPSPRPSPPRRGGIVRRPSAWASRQRFVQGTTRPKSAPDLSGPHSTTQAQWGRGSWSQWIRESERRLPMNLRNAECGVRSAEWNGCYGNDRSAPLPSHPMGAEREKQAGRNGYSKTGSLRQVQGFKARMIRGNPTLGVPTIKKRSVIRHGAGGWRMAVKKSGLTRFD